MSSENLSEPKGNPLQRWRQSAGLSVEKASRKMKMSASELEELEKRPVTSVPLRLMAEFIRFYKISPVELAKSLPRLEDLFSADK